MKTEVEKVRQRMKEIHNFVSPKENLFYLKSRWADEKEYEDFNEYKKVIRNEFDGFNVTKITRGFNIHIIENDIEYIVKIRMSSLQVCAKRV